MKTLLAVAIVLVLAGPAYAWNENGNYVVCRLAWLQMTTQNRLDVSHFPICKQVKKKNTTTAIARTMKRSTLPAQWPRM